MIKFSETQPTPASFLPVTSFRSNTPEQAQIETTECEWSVYRPTLKEVSGYWQLKLVSSSVSKHLHLVIAACLTPLLASCQQTKWAGLTAAITGALTHSPWGEGHWKRCCHFKMALSSLSHKRLASSAWHLHSGWSSAEVNQKAARAAHSLPPNLITTSIFISPSNMNEKGKNLWWQGYAA